MDGQKSVLCATPYDRFGNCLAVDLWLLCSGASYAYEQRPQKAGHTTSQPAQHTRVCFLAFFAQQTCQAVEEHRSFTSHATFCCKNQWRKTPTFNVSYTFVRALCVFWFHAACTLKTILIGGRKMRTGKISVYQKMHLDVQYPKILQHKCPNVHCHLCLLIAEESHQ